jgi:phage protein D
MPVALNPTFAISLGAVITSSQNPIAAPRLISIERDMRVAADSFELELTQPLDIKLMDEVEVELGMGDERKKVFTGRLVEMRPTLEGFRLRALGMMSALLNLRTSSVYEKQSVGNIVRDLVSKAGLTSEKISDGPELPCFYVDQRRSGYAYARDLADRLGYELYMNREGKVMFHALGSAASLDSIGGGVGAMAGAVAAAGGALAGGAGGYEYGKQLLRAGARQLTPPWGKVEVSGESPMSGHGDNTSHFLTANGDDYRGSAGKDEPVRIVLDPVARTKDLADRFAAGYLSTSARAARELYATVLGRADVELGDSVTLADVPDKLVNGSGYVQAIRHRLGERAGFLTDLRIIPEAAS